MEWIFVSLVLLLVVFHRTFRHVLFTLGVLGVLGIGVAALLYWVFTMPYNPDAFVSTPMAILLGFMMLVVVSIHGVAHLLTPSETIPSPQVRNVTPPAGAVSVWHPADTLPLLPWEPTTTAGKAYRARQLAYRRAHGLSLES